MSEWILEGEDLQYAYEDGTQALRGLSFAVRRGEKLAIMGPNGSGKSTLFLHLNGVLKPAAGRVLVNGQPVDYSRKGLLELRRRVGIVFQDPDDQLFCADVAGEISFGLYNLGLKEEEIRRRVQDVMEELGITPFGDKPVHALSGGQKKRVSIADILVMEPEVLILDEPASALDPRHARLIDGLIDRLSERGITVILSTHDVDRALIWADRVLLLEEGRMLAQGTPEEIFQDLPLLERTNLEQPAVLKMAAILRRQGLLPAAGAVPRRVEELETMLQERRS